VEGVPKEADARMLRQGASTKPKRYAERVVAMACKKDSVSLTELRSGSRRGKLPAARVKIVQKLVEDYGVPIAETARQTGISTSGVSKILSRLSNSLSRQSPASLNSPHIREYLVGRRCVPITKRMRIFIREGIGELQ